MMEDQQRYEELTRLTGDRRLAYINKSCQGLVGLNFNFGEVKMALDSA